jgi:hypothetical protein
MEITSTEGKTLKMRGKGAGKANKNATSRGSGITLVDCNFKQDNERNYKMN